MEDGIRQNLIEKRTSQPTEAVDVYMERFLKNIEENKKRNLNAQGNILKQENILTDLQRLPSNEVVNTIQAKSKFSLDLGSYSGFSFFFKTKEEYEQGKYRVEVLDKLIAGRYLSEDPIIKRFVDEHQEIAEAMLRYEIDNDLLPI